MYWKCGEVVRSDGVYYVYQYFHFNKDSMILEIRNQIAPTETEFLLYYEQNKSL